MGLLLAPLCLSFFSCSSSSKKEVHSPHLTLLEEISIVNDDGSEIKGRVNETTKIIDFPRLEPERNLKEVRFNAKLSPGAQLDKETYNFNVAEGDSESKRIIKVINETRYREYQATIRLKVPVYGGDFSKAVLYDHSLNGNNAYEHFSSMSTRSSDFDGKHVLIISRHKGNNPHLLAFEDIKKGVLNPIKLNTEGVASLFAGKLMQGRVYAVNMSSLSPTIYYWETPTSKPKIIFTDTNINTGGGGRYGDSMAMYLDDKGDGYIFLENNTTNIITRLHVTNFNKVTEFDEINIKASAGVAGGQYFSMSKVEGTPYYLYTGFDAPLALVDDGGNLALKISVASIDSKVNEAKIFEFNEKRYLLTITACRSGRGWPAETIYVYDISRGDNVLDALTKLDTNNYTPIYQQTLKGSGTTAPGTNCNYAIIDDKVYLFGGATDAGFLISEIPKMELEEEEF